MSRLESALSSGKLPLGWPSLHGPAEPPELLLDCPSNKESERRAMKPGEHQGFREVCSQERGTASKTEARFTREVGGPRAACVTLGPDPHSSHVSPPVEPGWPGCDPEKSRCFLMRECRTTPCGSGCRGLCHCGCGQLRPPAPEVQPRLSVRETDGSSFLHLISK